MINVDSGWPECGYAFSWSCGAPLRCPRCYHLLLPHYITWGQYLREKALRVKAEEAMSVDQACLEEKQLS